MFYTSCGLEKTNTGWKGYISYKDENGKWKKRKKTFKTKYKRDAQLLLNEWREQEEEKAAYLHNHKTVRQAIIEYMKLQLSYGQITESTYGTDLGHIKNLIQPYIGDRNFYELTSDEIQEWINTLVTERNLAPHTINIAAGIMSKTYRAAYKKGDIPADIFKNIVIPKEKRKKPETLDKENLDKLLLSVVSKPNNFYLPVYLGIYAGLRAGEMCALKWSDINFATNTITVDRNIARVYDGKRYRNVEGETKTHKGRIIPMASQLREALRNAEKPTGSSNDYVIYFRNPSVLSHNFADWCRRRNIVATSGRHCRTHTLRHTFATNAVACGMDIKSISSILGHANAAMTLNVYASDDEDAKRTGMEKLEAHYMKQGESDF